MRKNLFLLIFTIIFLFSFCISASADSLLVNNISHAGKIPVLDAATVPDGVYGETVVMYIRNPLLDDIPLEDLSEFSGSFYTVWDEGKLYFHFALKNFSEEDRFVLYFDLDDSNDTEYSKTKTLSVEFLYEEGIVKPSFVGDCEVSATTESFIESIETVSSVSGNTCIVETVLDFSTLYEDFSFKSGKRVGFDIVVSDKIEGGVVRYSWNDDTGVMMTNPDSLGTFVLGTQTVTEVEPEEQIEKEDSNPGTSDSDIYVYVISCLCAAALSVATLRKIQA